MDSSQVIGTGHLARCMTFATQIARHGAQVLFICRNLQGHVADLVSAKSFHLTLLGDEPVEIKSRVESDWLAVPVNQDAGETTNAITHHFGTAADWLITDHYSIDASWHTCGRNAANKIMVIDDLANRPHDCDLLLDCNFFAEPESRYRSLVPSHARMLLGPAYAPLREEFFSQKTNPEKRVMLYFGGSDTGELLEKAINAVAASDLANTYEVDVLLSRGSGREEQAALCTRHGFKAYSSIDDMAGHLTRTELVLGAGGISIWERLHLGVKSILVSIAANQEQPLKELAYAGYVHYLGKSDEVSEQKMIDALNAFMDASLEFTPYDISAKRDFLWEQLQSA